MFHLTRPDATMATVGTECTNMLNKGVTKTPAVSPASKTPAQPCLYYENTCYRKFTETPAVQPRI